MCVCVSVGGVCQSEGSLVGGGTRHWCQTWYGNSWKVHFTSSLCTLAPSLPLLPLRAVVLVGMRLIWQSRTVCLLSRARTLRVCVFLPFVVNNFKAGVSVDCPLIIRFIISSKEGLWSWQPHAHLRLQSRIIANTLSLCVCVRVSRQVRHH